MKTSSFQKILILLLGLSIFFGSTARAQVREEFEDKKSTVIDIESLEREIILQKQAKRKQQIMASLELALKYETNPRQTAIRKGDTSENVKYSFFYRRLLTEKWFFSFNYNFDGTSYGEYNELTNFLNHMRASVDRYLTKKISIGIGYDFSNFYYPDSSENDFYFHKLLLTVRHQFSRKIYQQIMLEEGFKEYFHARAYADGTAVFQDSDRKDFRSGAEYSIGAAMMDKLYFRLRTKYTANDSNALFQDYNDYRTLDLSPSFSYKLAERYLLNLSMMVTRRDYESREVASGDEERSDLIYTGNLGLRYDLDKSNVLNLGYGYTQGNSNDNANDYSSNSITCGWQHQF